MAPLEFCGSEDPQRKSFTKKIRAGFICRVSCLGMMNLPLVLSSHLDFVARIRSDLEQADFFGQCLPKGTNVKKRMEGRSGQRISDYVPVIDYRNFIYYQPLNSIMNLEK